MNTLLHHVTSLVTHGILNVYWWWNPIGQCHGNRIMSYQVAKTHPMKSDEIWWDHVKYPENPRETSYYDPHSWNSRHCPTFKKPLKNTPLSDLWMLRIPMSVKTWMVDPKKWGMVINPLIEVDIPTIIYLYLSIYNLLLYIRNHVYSKLGYTLKKSHRNAIIHQSIRGGMTRDPGKV